MLLGVIADDFTGAGDIANTLARGGMRTRLFVGPAAIDRDCEAGVVALKTRSTRAADAVARSLEALTALQGAGCRQFVFKYCSTFDSTPDGNIGPVAEALAAALGARGVVVCPAFPAAGRTVYQGHLFVGDRLVSETGMAAHPLTPMTDPDLCRWLRQQTAAPPGLVPLATVRAGSATLGAALAGGATLYVVDAVSEADLLIIAEAAADAPLLTGASGIALGLPGAFRARGLLRDGGTAFAPNGGPALLLAGSCSTATQAQVARYAVAHPVLRIDLDSLLGGAPVTAEALAFVRTYRDAAPLVTSTATPAEVAAAQARHGTARAATAIEDLFGALARAAVADNFGRIVVAGGETSGAVVTALGLTALDLGPEIAPGVPVLSAPGLALALKSGNFGGDDFLETAVRVLGGE